MSLAALSGAVLTVSSLNGPFGMLLDIVDVIRLENMYLSRGN